MDNHDHLDMGCKIYYVVVRSSGVYYYQYAVIRKTIKLKWKISASWKRGWSGFALKQNVLNG